MSHYSLDTISPDKVEEARKTAAGEIMRTRRIASAMRTIAGALDKAYVTKAIIPKVKPLFPDVFSIYLHQSNYCGSIELTIHYDQNSYNDDDSFTICTRENRRIDGAALVKSAENKEREANDLEESLRRLDEVVERYNAIADQYAEIYVDMDNFFHELPHADYLLQSRYKNTHSPESFAKQYTA